MLWAGPPWLNTLDSNGKLSISVIHYQGMKSADFRLYKRKVPLETNGTLQIIVIVFGEQITELL